MKKIKWDSAQDRHMMGTTQHGTVWIRFNRQHEPMSWYTIFNGVTNKWMTEEGDSVELIKELIQEEYQRFLTSLRLSEKADRM